MPGGGRIRHVAGKEIFVYGYSMVRCLAAGLKGASVACPPDVTASTMRGRAGPLLCRRLDALTTTLLLRC